MFGVIYLITNKLNNKYYVGQTTQSLSRRWSQHIKDAKRTISVEKSRKTYLFNTINKYGRENFNIEILCECPNQESLHEAEKFFIYFLASCKPSIGYNNTFGGEGAKLTQSTRQKMSESHKGKVCWDAIKKSADARKGRKRSPEAVKKMADAHRGSKWSEEQKAKHKELMSSSEMVEKNRKAQLGKKQSKECIEKRVSKLVGRKRTEEQKSNLREGHAKRKRVLEAGKLNAR